MANDQNKKINDITKGLGELLVSDIFNRHGITPQQTRPLSDEQKQNIKKLVEDLQRQVDEFLNPKMQAQTNDAKTDSGSEATDQAEETKPRKRIGIKKLSEEEMESIFKSVKKES